MRQLLTTSNIEEKTHLISELKAKLNQLSIEDAIEAEAININVVKIWINWKVPD